MVWAILLIWGINLCNSNNSVLGMVLLFLALNVLGLILGAYLLYNSKKKINIKKEKNVKSNVKIVTEK